ncbi:MAG: alkaline phosphatase D family protein, partial [Segetibacter sp.]|nr:alkaline phosphatase D family protein [Segetibacter sp.]
MDRRKSIKTLALSVVAPGVLLKENTVINLGDRSLDKEITDRKENQSFASKWTDWPDMNWAGPEFWGNRLQDWRLKDGKLECLVKGRNRTLHCLTTQLTSRPEAFETSVTVRLLADKSEITSNYYAGFRIGAKAIERFDDYRCAAVFGEGIDAGITAAGNLFIGTTKSSKVINSKGEVRIVLAALPMNNQYQLTLSVVAAGNHSLMDELTVNNVPIENLTGNLALVVHYANEAERSLGITESGLPLKADTTADKTETPSAIFSDWKIQGPKIHYSASQTFGPVCFAQYTLHKKILKLTAQCVPVNTVPGYTIALQIRNKNNWETLKEGKLHPQGRCVNFKMENWSYTTAKSYRIKLVLPLKNDRREYFYEGTIAAEPTTAEKIKVAIFSCNGDHGFPDAEIAPNVGKHKPDVAVFLGDQFYEATGGFRIQTYPKEKASLDYLRKWLMFGWSYREVFRHIPCAIIPDDHDVYHGNVWGEGGKHAPTDIGFTSDAQDLGGYKMPAEWVNMVQFTQTSHLPDPYDPTPVKQGIGVYYTKWDYAGISFAILEDRKFKSAPKNVLPAEAKVGNGFIQNPDFDIKKYREIDAKLLGERQMKFLNDWATDWSDGTEMKCVLSQTNFCTVTTLPKGSLSDSITSRLPIPEPEEYIAGDAPNVDMDSNGWPQKGRDEAVKVIRKCFAFHIAGDQHIASVVHYGVDTFEDSGFAFAGPALNNIFPRRWWPQQLNHQPLQGKAAYT